LLQIQQEAVMQSEVKEGVREAFTVHFGQLQSVAFEEWPELTTFGAEQIMSALAANLHRYRRPAGDGFVCWASAWIRRETIRHRFLTELFQKSHGLIYAAVMRGLYVAPGGDLAVEPSDNEADLYEHLLENPRKIDGMMKPKRAKTSTVLFALAKSRIRAYRSQIANRYALIERHLPDVHESGCEIAPEPDGEEKKDEMLAA
jgi:hypothetical protein